MGFPNLNGLPHGFIAALFTFAAAVALATPPPPSEARRALTVSAATDNYPYSYHDETGRLTGYGVDMLDAVAEAMRVQLQRVEVTSIEDIANLNAQRYDIGQFHTVPPEGSDTASYSQPILVAHGEIFVRSGDRRFASIEDLRTRHATVATPQQGQAYLLAAGFAPDNIRLSTSGEAMLALSRGSVDAVLLTRLTGLTQAYHHKIHNVEPLGLFLTDYKVSYCIATRKDDHKLLARINEALATLSTTGHTVKIYSRWFGRFDTREPSLREMIGPAALVLALAFFTTLILLHRQNLLRRRIVRQTEELSISHEILAEAQRFAHLGHSRRSSAPDAPAEWSEETYRIFEFDPAGGVPDYPQLLALAIPADRTRWSKALENAQRGGAPYELDITIVTRAGHRKTLNVRGRSSFDATGQQTGTFGTVQDVTASRAAAAALQQSELLLRALYQNLPLALSVVERREDDWYFLSLNPEALSQFGSRPPPDSGAPLPAALPADRCQFWREHFDRCTSLGETLHFEFESASPRKYFAAAVVPLILPGHPPRCCLLSEEITARKHKDAELAQSRRLRAIGELVGGIAHEFNNLLTPIALNTEYLLSQCSDRPAVREELDLIADAARRAGELTRRLLTFGRRNELQSEAVDLPSVVATNIALVRHTFDRRIVIAADLPGDLPPLHLPAGALQQILLNLLINARDALTEKLGQSPASEWVPRIEISAENLPGTALVPAGPPRPDETVGWIRLTVRDTGCGISPAVRERLFEPFFTTKGVGHGTGLGLATIWHLVTEFGGRIDLDSVPNHGTAFHLGLPVRSASTTTQASRPPEALPPRCIGKRHFLLADDESSVTSVVTRLLQRMGHQVTAVADGSLALEKLTSTPAAFDAVIMDLNMPGLTGGELAQRARAIPYHRPLLVMSGRISDDERTQLRACGVDVLLDKPFSMTAFEGAITRLFETRPTAPAAGSSNPN